MIVNNAKPLKFVLILVLNMETQFILLINLLLLRYKVAKYRVYYGVLGLAARGCWRFGSEIRYIVDVIYLVIMCVHLGIGRCLH